MSKPGNRRPAPADETPGLRALWAYNAERHQHAAGSVAAALLKRYLNRFAAGKRALPPTIDLPSGPDAPVAPRDGGPPCKHCGNKRFLLDAADQLQPCPYCHVAEGWRAQSLAAYSSLTGRAMQQTFDNFDARPGGHDVPGLAHSRDAARDFAERLDHWLVMHGQPGNGKSHLCAAVANHLRQRGRPCVYVSMPDLIESLKALFDEQTALAEGETYSQRLRAYQSAPVLLLDDIGAEKRSEWSETVLFELVDWRYRNRLPAMLVTNLDPYSRQDFDWRVIDRWTDTALCRVVANTAPSYRQR